MNLAIAMRTASNGFLIQTRQWRNWFNRRAVSISSRISFIRRSSDAYRSNRDEQLFILLPAFVGSSYIPRAQSLKAIVSLFAYRDINVDFLRVASLARVSIGATCCSSTPLSVVPHVRDHASADSSRSRPPSLSALVPCLPLCFALPDVTPVSFRRFRSFLVVFSRLFPTSQERRNALRLRRVYGACSPGGTKA